jgi:hypothetical protein
MIKRTIAVLARWSFATALYVGAIWLGIFVADQSRKDDQPFAVGLDVANRERTIRTLDLYPWTGWHMQSGFHHKGEMAFEEQPYHDFDVSTGRLGFFDVDVLNVAPKAACERRIILTGGSGAQGWGARSNANTIARRLEAHLTAASEATGVTVKVFNLAMGSSISHQNFIALNRFGHLIEPDLIVSYSGRNDYRIPEDNKNDGYYFFNQVLALSQVVRRSEGTGYVRWLSDMFPNLMERTALGQSLRMLHDYNRVTIDAREEYNKRMGFHGLSAEEFRQRVVIANHMNALRSIKRDFQGIPVALVWQAVLPDELSRSWFARGTPDFYERNFAELKKGLAGYVNDEWLFLDAHQHLKGRLENTGTHLGNAGQDLVARLIAESITPWIARNQNGCS